MEGFPQTASNGSLLYYQTILCYVLSSPIINPFHLSSFKVIIRLVFIIPGPLGRGKTPRIQRSWQPHQ